MTDREAPASSEATPHADDDFIDPGMVKLVQDFARLSGADVEEVEPYLMRLRVSPDDAAFFDGRSEHLLALSVSAVERYPASELPVVGGTFWMGLLDAIRARGSRTVGGTLPASVESTAQVPDVPIAGASVSLEDQRRLARGVARLTLKVTLSAGTTVEEELVDSVDIDLSTSLPVPDDVAEALLQVGFTDGEVEPLPKRSASPDRLASTLVRVTEGRIADKVRKLQEQSDRTLKQELGRIDGYYGQVKKDVQDEAGPGSPALEAIEREHQRRRDEEIRRHQVRVDVTPLQVIERGVLVEEAVWRLRSSGDVEAELTGQRYLVGEGGWSIRCPHCLEAPEALTVCRGAHPVGTECASHCSVCGHGFCPDHGHEACFIDGQPVCDSHAEECFSCGRVHCVSHQARCSEEHDACVECVVGCAVCERPVCVKHRFDTDEEAPRGPRTLCGECVVYCEGAKSEPVGIDESRPCATCGKHICERHQVRCVVDDKPHCSSHLKRADRSRRFFCEQHWAQCEADPELNFAADEIRACSECGRKSCNRHGVECHADKVWHCLDHMVALTDVPGVFACATHHSVCHVDGRVFSLRGTEGCEICGKATCRTHRDACKWCGADVCSRDLESGRCVTCGKLAASDDPPDELVAAVAALPGERKVRGWQTSRDGGRYVVELDLGWTRKLVLTVPHGSAEATRVMRHSLFGSAAEKGGR